jgi:hypothetical protein
MKQLSVIPLLLILLSAPLPAAAEEDPALAAFNEAKAHFADGDFVVAAELFKKAWELKPNWKLLYNIGQCEAAAKNYGAALEAFEGYLAQGGDEVSDLRREEVEKELDRFRRLVGYVEVVAPDGADILLDGTVRGTAPLAGTLIVTAGIVHELRVVVDGGDRLVRTLKVTGGQTISVNVPLIGSTTSEEAPSPAEPDSTPAVSPAPETTPPPPVSPTPAPARKNRLVPPGIALLAIGGAALIAGVATGAAALHMNDNLTDQCPDGICPEEYHSDNDRMRALAMSSTVLVPAGGALAVVGAVLVIVGMQKKHESRTAVIPRTGPGFAGLTCIRRF